MFFLRKGRLLLRTLTFRKVFNFLSVWISFYLSRFLKRPVIIGMPVKIGIEPTTYCNLRCPECISGLRAFTRPTGMLDMPVFQSLIDQSSQDLIYLLMYFQGEPFLNTRFLEMVRYASGKGVYVATSTNGHYLDAETAAKTVASGISEVLISVDGVSQQSYEAYRVGGDLEKVKSGIRNLVQARKDAGTLHPLILIQFLVVRPNEKEIPEIQKLGLELGADKVLLKTAQIYDYEAGSPLLPGNEKYSRYRKMPDGKFAIRNPLKNQCWKLWMGPEITWDGKVLPCCFDKDAAFVLGELEKDAFRKIWNSEEYNRFRISLLKSRSQIEMCRNCSEGTRVWA